MPFDYRNKFQIVERISVEPQNRLDKSVLDDYSVHMILLLFPNHPSLVSYNSIGAIYYGNYLYMTIRLNSLSCVSMCFAFQGKIELIYHPMWFRYCCPLVRTISIVHLIFQSNKLVHSLVFASLFVYCNCLCLEIKMKQKKTTWITFPHYCPN